MTKSSIKKYSILGLVLIAASAVTAAIIPTSKEDKDSAGKLIASTAGGVNDQTCIATNNPDDPACNVTAGTFTTAGGGSGTSANATANNTTT